MPSNSSHLSLFSSSSSRKHSSKSSSKHDSKHDNKQLVRSADPDLYHLENKSLWKEVKLTEGNPSTMILALVAPEQRKPMKKLIDEKIKQKKIRSSVVVTTPQQLHDHLQGAMNNGVKKAVKSLHLLVSSTVRQLTYHIEDFVDQVFVKPIRKEGEMDALFIDSASTYCGWPSCAWSERPGAIPIKKQLTLLEGCYFNGRSLGDGALHFLDQPRLGVNLSNEEQMDIRAQFMDLRDTIVSEEQQQRADPSADQPDSGFEKWKKLLATVIAAGAGKYAAGMAGGMWLSSGGIFVKGPLGLYLAAGYVNFAAAGAVGGVGVGTAVLAYGAIYYIPWDMVWKFFTDKLQQIWEWVKDIFIWIKDTLMYWAKTIATNAWWVIQGAPKAD